MPSVFDCFAVCCISIRVASLLYCLQVHGASHAAASSVSAATGFTGFAGGETLQCRDVFGNYGLRLSVTQPVRADFFAEGRRFPLVPQKQWGDLFGKMSLR